MPHAVVPDLSIQIARLFFDRQLSKVEIAARLGISRFRVARLIDGALADGLVRIEYRDLPSEDRDLARAMEDRFGLDVCAVAAVADEMADGERRSALARLAASLVDGLLAPRDVIGIAWGSTLAAVVREVPARSDASLAVVQLAGSSTRLGRDQDAGALARTLADRLGAAHHAIYAPAFVETPAVRRALGREPEIAATVDRFGDLTLAIVGIGAMPADGVDAASSLVRSGVLDPTELARLASLGAIGDLVVHPFDAAGRFVAPDLAARAVAIGVDALRAVPRVVAVAGGTHKAMAIHGALQTGLIGLLVTDAPTARAVMDIA